jgi:hypothetical protein
MFRRHCTGGVPVSLPRLRAPRDDGAILAEPPLATAGELLARNRQALAAAAVTILEKPLAELRRLARIDAWDACRHYHSDAGESLPAAPAPGQSWLLAGHQPELFHPGVWFKNFALFGLAQQHDGFSLNLVVDNDAARSPLLRIPTPAHVASVPYDRWQGESPYEERPVLDEALFASLPERVLRFQRDWPFEPMLPAFWREVLRQRERTPLVGERLAAARRAYERRWGCTQAEVPLSRLCRGEAFAIFAGHLLANASRLREVYNAAVHDYRHCYRIKSAYHPVPDLTLDGDWCELPLWAWRVGQPRRTRLFARPGDGELHLRAGSDRWPSLPRDPDRLVAEWRTLEPRGYKVRTRALTTTLFARLLLGDVFLHGIGGGKYDELTDALLARFFGGPASGYVVLTATLVLPLPRFAVDAAACRRLAREHRDLWYNPQRHFADGVPVPARDLIQIRQECVLRACTTHAQRRARCRELRSLNERLRSFLAAEEQRLRQDRDECLSRLRVNGVLGRRDYAFCLYPQQMLSDFYRGFF